MPGAIVTSARPRGFAWVGMEADVRVDERFLRTIVLIGTWDGWSFTPHGTGFLAVGPAVGDQRPQTIVTARHVIDGVNSDTVHIRLNNHDRRAEVFPTAKSDWQNHPDERVDVSVCPTSVAKDRFDILHLP